MRRKAKILTVIITLFCVTLTVHYGQTKNGNKNKSSNTITENLLKGLHKATDKEKEELNLSINPSLKIYTTEGKRITFDDFLPLIQSGNYSLDPYINKSGELKAAVVRPATEEEKSEMKKILSKANEENVQIGKSAKPFNVTDINGNNFSLESLKGKIVVINFWFVECKPCIMEIPELNKLVEEFKDKDVIFLGITFNDTTKLNSFLERNKFNYNIIPKSKDVISNYGIKSFPTHIVIDQYSKVAFSTTGLTPNTISKLKNEIEKLLKQ